MTTKRIDTPTGDPDLPPLLRELSLTACAWRTSYQLGAQGHQFTLRSAGRHHIASTGWRPTFPEAAAAYAELMVRVCEAGRARYHEDAAV
jgi:hypothetical protein